ncbi:MAG: hypothetical protein ACYYKD_04975 [Rhodospirillales bacterium]
MFDPSPGGAAAWWVTAFELPALAGLLWLTLRTRRDIDERLDRERERQSQALRDLRESHAAYKLEVAKTYASIAYMKEVETRLTSHLMRIENKLDARSEAPAHTYAGGPA